MIRALLVFALIALPIALSYTMVGHHEGSGIFETLCERCSVLGGGGGFTEVAV